MKQHLKSVVLLLGAVLQTTAAVPPPEELLPDDTLVLLTAPDFTRARDIYTQSPQGRFWRDPAMRPFKDKFVNKLKSEVVTPLERELDIKLSDYTDLAQGQMTIALTRNNWEGGNDVLPATIFLLDTRDKSEQLKQRLADIKQKWVDSGKDFKTEKIRDVEFSVLIGTGGDLLKAFSRATSGEDAEETDEAPAEEGSGDSEPAEKKKQIFLGQADSLLIIGNQPSVIEKVLIRLSGGLVPSLRENAAYEANHNAMFRDVPVYGWVNSGKLFEILQRKAKEEAEKEEPNLLNLQPDKIIESVGLAGLKTVAFSYAYSPEGGNFHLFLGAPESSRRGFFKILATESKDAQPPAFVPGKVIKYQRWRLDGQQTWNNLEQMLTSISPSMYGGLKFLLDTAEAAAKEKDPNFDIRKNLIGNLGDDLVIYQETPREKTIEQLNSPPTLYLVGSPNAEQLAGALQSIFVLVGGAGGVPEEREFLGRKIYSIKLPAMPTGTGKPAEPRSLSYAASGGYVGVSSDVALLEEYLRSADSTAKPLRETAGLNEAAQKVGGMGTGFFGYADQLETMRVAFEALQMDAAADESMVNFMLQSTLITETGSTIKDWVDFSLLPDFTQVARYFYFTVYAWNTTSDGLHMEMFAPTPPAMKQQ